MTLKNSMTLKKTVRWWDISGMFFSSLCLLHCIATPVLLAGATAWFVSEWVHTLFLLILIPVTGLAIWRSKAWQTRRWVVVMLLAGLTLVGSAILVGEFVGELAEIALTVTGSLMLIAGHIGNRHSHSHHHTHV
ncbi:MAG: MerC domain-containing protein [Bacteroidota bacterium]